MLVTFQVDSSLIYGGKNEPAALVELHYAAGGSLSFFCLTLFVLIQHLNVCSCASRADFGKDIHAKLTTIIAAILSDKLGVPNNRCHIVV